MRRSEKKSAFAFEEKWKKSMTLVWHQKFDVRVTKEDSSKNIIFLSREADFIFFTFPLVSIFQSLVINNNPKSSLFFPKKISLSHHWFFGLILALYK
jgi:hypothetical protein